MKFLTIIPAAILFVLTGCVSTANPVVVESFHNGSKKVSVTCKYDTQLCETAVRSRCGSSFKVITRTVTSMEAPALPEDVGVKEASSAFIKNVKDEPYVGGELVVICL